MRLQWAKLKTVGMSIKNMNKRGRGGVTKWLCADVSLFFFFLNRGDETVPPAYFSLLVLYYACPDWVCARAWRSCSAHNSPTAPALQSQRHKCSLPHRVLPLSLYKHTHAHENCHANCAGFQRDKAVTENYIFFNTLSALTQRFINWLLLRCAYQHSHITYRGESTLSIYHLRCLFFPCWWH